MSRYFTPGFFTFLKDLKTHNDRQWFADHRDRYVADVEAPMLAFIADLSPRLRAISKAYVADPRRAGGSMFRIYRDTRFSHDKSPYKAHAGARFPHETRKTDPNVPAFYLHLAPRERFGGGGVYHLDMPALVKTRQHIVAEPRAWAAVLKTGIDIEGDTLTRPPAGFDPKHRFIDDLKRKDLYTLTEFTTRDVVSPRFLDAYVESCERAAPLLRFLTTALGLRW